MSKRDIVKSIATNDRGMALLMTIMVITLLVAITAHFGLVVRREYFSSATFLDGEQLNTVVRSGLNIGAALVEADGKENSFDTSHDSWANLSETSFAGFFTRGDVVLEIKDHSGKLQINSLIPDATDADSVNLAVTLKETLGRLLLAENFGVEDEELAREIVDALVDWLDQDDKESDYGAESSYYLSLSPPYESKNGSVEFIEELLLVRGITQEILFGKDNKGGLTDYITVYGEDAKININTAPLGLIKALEPLITDEMLEEMDQYRKTEDNKESLESISWYSALPFWPGDVVLPNSLLTTKSSYFNISSKGTFHDLHRSASAVIKRNKDGSVITVRRKMEYQ